MGAYRSSRTHEGKRALASRALWRATGMTDEDFEKPIIAVVNSFVEFVPGHVHLKDLGQMVAREIERAGGVAKEFNTIAVDDGIAMGHEGMLYSLPSRDLIADSIEYMVNAHCADAMVCISNCDKITPGMLMAAMRLNLPAVFVSGGPMEAGKVNWQGKEIRIDAVDAMVVGYKPESTEEDVANFERSACPTCGSCAGMFTANSMNCLTEALGLSLPGNGTVVATHADRRELFLEAGRRIVDMTKRHYLQKDQSVLPRSIANFKAFENAMRLDIAMGGSTNTVLHLLAAAFEGEVPFTMKDIDRLSRVTPHLSKLSPSSPLWHVEDVHRAGGVMALLGILDRQGMIHRDVTTVHAKTMGAALERWDIGNGADEGVKTFYRAAPGGVRTKEAFSQNKRWPELDLDRAEGCIRDFEHAYSKDGGLAVLYGNLAPDGCIVKTAGVDAALLKFRGPAIVFESENDATRGIRQGKVKAGDIIVIRYEGPKGGPGMQEMLAATSSLKAVGLATKCALITDGRFSGATSGLSVGHISPEAASGGVIGLIEPGDPIEIDIPNRSLSLAVPPAVVDKRRAAMDAKNRDAWKPNRDRKVSAALRAYAALATSASTGAVRNVEQVERR